MHNTIFPVRIDEVTHPRVANESFMKIYLQPRRSLTSSPSDESNGIGNQSDISVVLRNIGDNDVSFKVMAALRNHAAESQDGDTAYTEAMASQTLKAGGFLQVLLQEVDKNLFSFVMTSAQSSVVRITASSASDLIVWKSLEREGEKGTHNDTFLQDESPKAHEVVDTTAHIRTLSVTTSWVALPDLNGVMVDLLNRTGADLQIRYARETGSDQLITVSNGAPVSLRVVANASEIEIKAASANSGVQIVVS
jgi:hypothetical protein